MTIIGVYFSGKSGGVDVVGHDICIELELEGYEVCKLVGLKQLILSLLLRRCNHYVLSLYSGLFGLFCRGIYVVHGYPRIKAYGKLKFLIVWIGHLICMRLSTRVIYVSELTHLIWTQFLWGSNGIVILNKHQPSRLIESKLTKISQKELVLLYVGRIVREKRVYETVQAFISSGLIDHGVKFYIVGSGPDFNRCNSIKSKAVIFSGFVSEDDKNNLFKRAKVFVSLQELEPMGLTYLEASRHECSVVAPIYSGASETVPKGKLYTCDPTNQDSISLALRKSFGFEGDFREVSITPTYGSLF